jgi:hypothetical protein
MNLFTLFSEIEAKDPTGFDELNDRRNMLKTFTGRAGRIALATLPFAIGSLFQKAYAGGGPSTSIVLGVLNDALKLEYLEQEFYNTGLQTNGLIPSTAEYNVIAGIRNHETDHVALLQTTIQSLGGTPIASPKFDFTCGNGSGHGPLADVFSRYEVFLALAQVLEDTGVRAYKGQLSTLLQGGPILTTALNIHSVEARHASTIRQFRYARGFATIKPWITLADSGVSDAFNAVYAGEDNTVEAGLQVIDINGYNLNDEAASEAFDEPLSGSDVQAILTPFLA